MCPLPRDRRPHGPPGGEAGVSVRAYSHFVQPPPDGFCPAPPARYLVPAGAPAAPDRVGDGPPAPFPESGIDP